MEARETLQTIRENEERYGAEARERYGNEAVDAANERRRCMSEEEWADREALGEAIIEQLGRAMADGSACGPEAQELAKMHARWVALSWGAGAYCRDAHLGLARGYLADSRFVEYYDSRAGAGATSFLVEALQNCL